MIKPEELRSVSWSRSRVVRSAPYRRRLNPGLCRVCGGLCKESCRPGQNELIASTPVPRSHLSHAHLILENFLERFYFNGKLTDSGIDVVSLFVDQFPADRDMARDVAKQYGIRIYPTIAEALRRGGAKLAVAAIDSGGDLDAFRGGNDIARRISVDAESSAHLSGLRRQPVLGILGCSATAPCDFWAGLLDRGIVGL